VSTRAEVIAPFVYANRRRIPGDIVVMTRAHFEMFRKMKKVKLYEEPKPSRRTYSRRDMVAEAPRQMIPPAEESAPVSEEVRSQE